MLLILLNDVVQHPPLIVFQKANHEANIKHTHKHTESYELSNIILSVGSYNWPRAWIGWDQLDVDTNEEVVYARHTPYMAKIVSTHYEEPQWVYTTCLLYTSRCV